MMAQRFDTPEVHAMTAPQRSPPFPADAAPGALAWLAAQAGLASRTLQALRAAGAPFARRPFRAATPTFRHHDVDDLAPCRMSRRFPAFSITGPTCALNCHHCRAEVLAPMAPATTPEALDRQVREAIAREGLAGFLLSGGSDRRNEVRFERFLPVVAALKRDHPALQVAVHTGLVDTARAAALAAAGVDVAMLDIIGSPATIREVYRLDRPVADFERSLHALLAAGLHTVPHIVVGLHFGTLRGEDTALEIIAGSRAETVILVVLMPQLAAPGLFRPPDPGEVAEFFARARTRLADRTLLLGCARPAGRKRLVYDAAALLAGFDGIAHPAEGIAAAARALGRTVDQPMACCGLAPHRAQGCAA